MLKLHGISMVSRAEWGARVGGGEQPTAEWTLGEHHMQQMQNIACSTHTDQSSQRVFSPEACVHLSSPRSCDADKEKQTNSCKPSPGKAVNGKRHTSAVDVLECPVSGLQSFLQERNGSCEK